MTTRYHFNPETGHTNLCKAQPGKCPLKNDDGTPVSHGDDKKSVQEQGLKTLNNNYGSKTLAKNSIPIELNIHSSEINNLFQEAYIYKKKAKVVARKSTFGEKLETVLKDGTVETTRILSGNEMVITNPSGEQYAVDMNTFKNRYEQNTNGEWVAKGTSKIIKNPTNKKIEIIAPWGEKQYGDKNCFIAQALGNKNDRYIIGHDEFIETYGNFDEPVSTPVDKDLPQIAVSSKLSPKKGGSYYGLKINDDAVQEHLKIWRNEIGEDTAQDMENAKQERDGEYSFHITVLSPKETRQLKKSGVSIQQPDFNIQLTGIGSVSDDDKEAWFITAKSQEIDEYRESLGLTKHNLHITIGFKNGDIHNKPKDETSLRII